MMTSNGVIPKICLNWTKKFSITKMLFLDVFPLKISKKYFFQSFLKNSWNKRLKTNSRNIMLSNKQILKINKINIKYDFVSQ